MDYYTIPLQAPASGVGQPTGGSGRPPYCSDQNSYHALQTMLRDLGYYDGPTDGTMSPGGPTERAVIAFAQAEGISLSSGIQGNFCDRLIAQWNAQQAAAPPPPPPNGASTPAPTVRERIGARRYFQRAPAVAPPPADSGMPTNLATTSPGALDRARQWWSAQSMPVKVAVVGGSVAVVGGGIYLAVR